MPNSKFNGWGDPQRALRYAIERVIGDDATRESRLRWADRREVVVQRNAEFAWFIDFSCIDLNFVGLRVSRSQKKYAKDQCRATGNPEQPNCRYQSATTHYRERQMHASVNGIVIPVTQWPSPLQIRSQSGLGPK